MAERKAAAPAQTPRPAFEFDQSSKADLLVEIREIMASERRALVDEFREAVEEDRRLIAEAAARTALTLRDEAGPLLDANAVARRLGRTPQWVRENREKLGAVPLGDGPRPRLGFPPEAVAAWVACSAGSRPSAEEPASQAASKTKRRARSGRGADLLPIRGPIPTGGSDGA